MQSMIRRLLSLSHVALISTPSFAFVPTAPLVHTMPRRSDRLRGLPPATTTRSALPQKRGSSSSSAANNHDDYDSMKVVELKELLRQKGLPVSGVKKDLIDRLLLASSDDNVASESDAAAAIDKPKRIRKSTTKKAKPSPETASADTYCLPRTRELQLKSNLPSLTVIGVDEAGRGPLAGPVVAAACFAPTNIAGIIDSKKITKEEERERLYEELIVSPGIIYAVAVVSARRIDEINILQATLEGMRMAVEGVMGLRESGENNVASAERDEISYIVTGGEKVVTTEAAESYHALIDGNRLPKEMPCNAESMTKGDGREYSIGAASILAKVTRDRLMHEYSEMYPEYNLSQHKGYPTAAHMSLVRKFGASPIHRRTFAPLKHWEFDENGKDYW